MAAIQPTLFDVEIWKDIPGWEDLYQASTHGRVRSKDRVRAMSNGAKRGYKGRVLDAKSRHKKGYAQVSLCRDGEQVERLVHSLILETFVGPCPDGMQTRHIDGNPGNNNLINLRWGTLSENNLDRVRHGTHHETRKTHCPQGHPLAMPNLVPSSIKRGHRLCLACNRAHNRIHHYPHLKPHLQSVSDDYYRALMAAA